MTARDECDGFFIVHRHARKRLANVACGRKRIRISVGTFWVHIDETHLHCSEWILKIAITAISLVTEPLVLRAPVRRIRFPHISATAAETKRCESHRLKRNVACEQHEIRPRNVLAILLLNRPQQTPRFVEIYVVGPTVQRRESLHARTTTAATITHAIRSRTVPR